MPGAVPDSRTQLNGAAPAVWRNSSFSRAYDPESGNRTSGPAQMQLVMFVPLDKERDVCATCCTSRFMQWPPFGDYSNRKGNLTAVQTDFEPSGRCNVARTKHSCMGGEISLEAGRACAMARSWARAGNCIRSYADFKLLAFKQAAEDGGTGAKCRGRGAGRCRGAHHVRMLGGRPRARLCHRARARRRAALERAA